MLPMQTPLPSCIVTMPSIIRSCRTRSLEKAAIREMFRREFAAAKMTCLPEAIYEAGDVAILEWKDPLELRGCGFFTVEGNRIVFQRGYWDKLSFLKKHRLPIE
jgi:limonene-1,2-epoxide hydrolase